MTWSLITFQQEETPELAPRLLVTVGVSPKPGDWRRNERRPVFRVAEGCMQFRDSPAEGAAQRNTAQWSCSKCLVERDSCSSEAPERRRAALPCSPPPPHFCSPWALDPTAWTNAKDFGVHLTLTQCPLATFFDLGSHDFTTMLWVSSITPKLQMRNWSSESLNDLL